MAYSTKQKLFAEFMLKRIGFTQSELIEQYLTQLENVFGRWSEWTNNNGYTSLTYSVSDCIQMLVDEIEIKKNKQEIQSKELNQVNISATELSNYVYCPVSYSVAKSFVINKPTGQEFTDIGVTLHEQLRLIDKKIPFNLSETEAHQNNVFQDEIIRRIRSSQIVFIGHTEDKQYFTNEDAQFVGQPDYIFKDKEGKYFIVEEKFHSIKPESHNYWQEHPNQYNSLTNRFYDNHQIQVISYLRNIKEYKLDYGYLIYWYYQTSKLIQGNTTYGEFPQIHDVRTKQIVLNDETEKFYETTVANIRNLQNEKVQSFNAANLHINKCVGCVVNKYCSHKARRLNTFALPYRRDDLKLFFVDFPY
jgi:CRISPR/Cas system-associated exonuclease Cas4 (RecB family)